MYIKNSNFAIYLGLALIVGFGLSFAFTSLSDSSMMSGDISKASRYNNVKEDPEITVLEEKLRNDENYMELTKNTMAYLDSRVGDLDELTSRTIDVCSDIPELKEAIKSVISLNAKAYNTKQSLMQATDVLNQISSGKKVMFSQVSNNIYVGYNKIEDQLSIGRAFVNQATSYLVDNPESEKSEKVADLVKDWTSYCMQDAILNGDEAGVAYWNEKVGEVSSESPAVALSFFKSICKSSLGQEFIGNLQQDFAGNLQQDFVGNLQQDFVGNLQQDFVRNLQQDFVRKLQQDFVGNLQQEFIGNLQQDFVGNLQQDFVGNLQQEFIGNLQQDFVGNLQQDFAGNLK